MIAIAFIAGFLVYLIICVIVIALVVKWAKKRGRSQVRWGIGAAIVMYHLVFWDFLPTLVVYKYYCATKAGFWVYKTPEQWKAENPGVAETLTWREMSPDYKAPGVTFGYRINERIIWIDKQKKGSIIPVGISEELIMDVKNDEILVRLISVWSGYSRGKGYIKFWTKWPMYKPQKKELYKFKNEYKMLGRKVK
jgi:hypothetical protein